MIPSLYELYSPYRAVVYYYNVGVCAEPIRFALPVSHAYESDLYLHTYRYFAHSQKVLEAMNIGDIDKTIVLFDIEQFYKERSGNFYISPKRRIFYKDRFTGTLYLLLGKNKQDRLLESKEGEIAIFSARSLRNKARFEMVIHG